jgi:hypothetical protein
MHKAPQSRRTHWLKKAQRLTAAKVENPDKGADLLGALSNSGWDGEHSAAEHLLVSLLAENVDLEDPIASHAPRKG